MPGKAGILGRASRSAVQDAAALSQQKFMSEPFVPKRGAIGPKAGVLSSRRVRLVSFFIVGVGLFLTCAICVLAIWEYTSTDAAWRSISTLCVISATLFLFTALNEWFGLRVLEAEQSERELKAAE